MRVDFEKGSGADKGFGAEAGCAEEVILEWRAECS
jgi:hypothetical protein